MIIDVIADGIEIKDSNLENHRTACRGIVKKENLYLMVFVPKQGIYTFPGGGLEVNETEEECVIRELLEETGVIVKVLEKKVTVNEYFIESVWSHIYFTCELVSENNEINLTEEEKSLGMEVVWKTFEEIIDIFENYQTIHEYGPNVHNREFLGFINSI